MNWKQEILSAMLTIKSACAKNQCWADCSECPFDDYCSVCERVGLGILQEWEITAKEN